jgi:YHS domain-containing protein
MRLRPAVLALVLLFSSVALAGGKVLVNVDKEGLAIQGYDPVAYFDGGVPTKGDPAITTTHDGATYRFATEEHKKAFESDPAKYAPAFGGFCGYGMSKGYAAKVDPTAFVIQDGHLILQYSKDVSATWAKDPQGLYAKALANWPKVVEQKGK